MFNTICMSSILLCKIFEVFVIYDIFWVLILGPFKTHPSFDPIIQRGKKYHFAFPSSNKYYGFIMILLSTLMYFKCHNINYNPKSIYL